MAVACSGGAELAAAGGGGTAFLWALKTGLRAEHMGAVLIAPVRDECACLLLKRW